MTAKNYTQITGKSEEVANYLHKNDTALLADSMSGDFECWYSILVNDDGLVEHPTGADDEAKFDYHADYLEDLLDDLEDEYADKDAAGEAWCDHQSNSETLDNPNFREAVKDLTDQANAWLSERN